MSVTFDEKCGMVSNESTPAIMKQNGLEWNKFKKMINDGQRFMEKIVSQSFKEFPDEQNRMPNERSFQFFENALVEVQPHMRALFNCSW